MKFKKRKKKFDSINYNAGNVEYNNMMFNKMASSYDGSVPNADTATVGNTVGTVSTSAAVGESCEQFEKPTIERHGTKGAYNFYGMLSHEIRNKEKLRNNEETIQIECYIENSPDCLNCGHVRWSEHDMNHIYKENDSEDTHPNEYPYLRILTEKNLNRISKGHEKLGYAIISASRSELSEEENNKRAKELKDRLRQDGYSYISVYGGYKELGSDKASIEKSFVVYPYNIVNHEELDFNKLKKDIIELGKTYDQDSVLICEPNGKPRYIALKPGAYEDRFEYVDMNDTNNEFFTAIKKWNDMSANRKNHDWSDGKSQRFTFTNET